MAKKPSITTIASGYYSRTALNTNFENLRDKFDNTLSLDGSTPNAMQADLDMNSNDILNAGEVNVNALTIGGVALFPANTQIATTYSTQNYTGNGVTTTYAMGFNPATKSNVDAYIDGVYQNQDAFNISGTNLTFTAAPPVNSAIEIKVPVSITDLVASDAQQITYTQGGAGSVNRTVQSRLRDFVSVKDFGAVGNGVTDDTAAIQAAIDYCVANQKDLLVPDLCYISASLEIDRLVDSAGADNYFTITSASGGGFLVDTAIPIFSTSLVNPSDPNLPVTQMVRFDSLKFEVANSATAAYVLDENKFLRVVFESCNFRRIKCLSAPAGKLTQTITFQNCQARRWTGTFFKSGEATFDLKVIGGLWEAGGDAFDIDFPVGTAFIGANIEGMASFAIKYTGGYGLTVQGCYFEENGVNFADGCSIDGSAGTGLVGSEAVSIIGNYFSGDTDIPAKPQVKWGDDVTAISTGNLCSTTLHQFGVNSRVNIFADYARTAISTNDATSYSGIRNDMQIGAVFRAEGNYTFGGIVRSEFVGGSGGFLRLRSLQDKVESATGLDIDDNGDVKITGNAGLAGYMDIDEISGVPSPAPDFARLYARDNGSGKTQLVVQFSTGALQILATEP
jgi:hypothetical protein